LVGVRGRITLVAALALVAACRAAPPPSTVSADRYDAFWLWAGVKPQPVLARAKTLYILEGEVTARDPGRLVSLRPGVPKTNGPALWMVVRVETLRWGPGVLDAVLARLGQWRAAGNRVTGVQIDFDAHTRHLDEYASFLRDLRRRLPNDTKLGITGLLDWSANGDPQALVALGDTIDEIVLQTYQGRHTIPGYDAYLEKLGRFARPFKIGLVEGGEWTEPATLRTNPQFRGYVVFLVNPPTREDGGRSMQH
jgi:Protein of unknown function (DUF3142)